MLPKLVLNNQDSNSLPGSAFPVAWIMCLAIEYNQFYIISWKGDWEEIKSTKYHQTWSWLVVWGFLIVSQQTIYQWC